MDIISFSQNTPFLKLRQRDQLRQAIENYGLQSIQYLNRKEAIKKEFIRGVAFNSMRSLGQAENTINLEKHMLILGNDPMLSSFYGDLASQEVKTIEDHLYDSDTDFCQALQAFNHQATEKDMAFNRRLVQSDKKTAKLSHQSKVMHLRTKLQKKKIDSAYQKFFTKTLTAIRKDLHFTKAATEHSDQALDALVAHIEGATLEASSHTTKKGHLKKPKKHSKKTNSAKNKTLKNLGKAQEANAQELAPQQPNTVANLESSKPLNQKASPYVFAKFKYHPRVRRWQTQDVQSIRQFKDFRQGEWRQLYLNNTDQRNLQLRRYHCLPGLIDLFKDHQLREQYAFTGNTPYEIGMLTEFVHAPNQLTEYGIITLAGNANTKHIYHSMFSPLTEAQHSYGQLQQTIASIIESNDNNETNPIAQPQEEQWRLGQVQYAHISSDILEVQFPNEQHFIRLHRVK